MLLQTDYSENYAAILDASLAATPYVTTNVVQNTRPTFAARVGGSGYEINHHIGKLEMGHLRSHGNGLGVRLVEGKTWEQDNTQVLFYKAGRHTMVLFNQIQ